MINNILLATVFVELIIDVIWSIKYYKLLKKYKELLLSLRDKTM